MVKQILFNKNINIKKRAYIWNTISSAFFSIQSALFLLIITRVGGETEAGSFIILFTVAQTLTSVGNYSLRDFHASDINEEYSFNDYYTTRIITCSLMLLLAFAYGLWNDLPAARFIVLLSLVGYRFVECIEDVYHGDIQRQGRFDVASICMALRIIISSFTFCVTYLIFKNQQIASISLFLSSFFVYVVLVVIVKSQFVRLRPHLEKKRVIKLLTSAFPVFIGSFLYSYLINAPKYAIDEILTNEAQTIYNILFMPIFVVNVLSMFIYKPMIVKLSETWVNGSVIDFTKIIIKQLIIIFILTCFIMLGGWTIGFRLLEMIYDVSLVNYKDIFILLIFFGGVTAAVYFLNTVITLIRKQKFIIIGYGFSYIINGFITDKLVGKNGIPGAVQSYGIIFSLLMFFYLSVIFFEIMKRRKSLFTFIF